MKRVFIFLLFVFVPHFAVADIMCDDAATDYYAVYEPNTYTCESGKYLPANTDVCVACPAGYTCAGGTFTFNENEYQGAVIDSIGTSTMNNVCADNFPADMYAVYEPDTVNLTWNDGNGNTTTSTCTYDGLITLPPEPTRPGYIFNGWKIQTNE